MYFISKRSYRNWIWKWIIRARRSYTLGPSLSSIWRDPLAVGCNSNFARVRTRTYTYMCIHIHRLRRDIPLWAFVSWYRPTTSVWRSGRILLSMEQALADIAQFYILYTDLPFPFLPLLFSFVSLLRFLDCLREFVSFCGRGFRPRRYTSSYEIASWSGAHKLSSALKVWKTRDARI